MNLVTDDNRQRLRVRQRARGIRSRLKRRTDPSSAYLPASEYGFRSTHHELA
jgi:hypothetical protein